MNIPVTPKNFLQFLVLMVGGLFFAMLVPLGDQAINPILAIPVAVFVGMFTSFLVFQAAERRRFLLTTIALELNKLRRIYHLSKNLSVASTRFRMWFTDIHGFLYEYLTFFSKKDFNAYNDSNALFRKLSYHIYTIPEVETKKEEALFEDLLRTTAVVAESPDKDKGKKK